MGEKMFKVDADDATVTALSAALKDDPAVARGLATDAAGTLAKHGIRVDARTATAIEEAVAGTDGSPRAKPQIAIIVQL